MESFASKKKIKIIAKVESLPEIEADPDRINQVLGNLIHNAIKFSKENTEVIVNATQSSSNILFSVQDQGPGMSSEDQIRVFEPFFQTEETLNRRFGGTGLGLAICRGIVESQNGKIWVHSSEGSGSVFYFTLPINPVKEIEPIKVLFSAKTIIETKIKNEFTSMLGPMGLVEFNELKYHDALSKDDLNTYIDILEEMKILQPTPADKFRGNISKIFGEKTLNESHNLLNESSDKDTGLR
jgi:hypothetical protein